MAFFFVGVRLETYGKDLKIDPAGSWPLGPRSYLIPYLIPFPFLLSFFCLFMHCMRMHENLGAFIGLGSPLTRSVFHSTYSYVQMQVAEAPQRYRTKYSMPYTSSVALSGLSLTAYKVGST